MSRWFRMYDEVLDDPKVQRLPGDDFKAWVNILCLASRKDGALPSVEDIGFALRLDARKAAAVFGRLIAAGLIDETEGRFFPHGWNDRQFKSDVSTDRVKQFRQRKKAVSGNDDETFHATAPDTDTETDSSVDKSTDDKSSQPDQSDKQFWDAAKAFVGPAKASLVGKWAKDHGKPATAEAITRAQLERPADRVQFIEGCLRARKREAADAPIC